MSDIKLFRLTENSVEEIDGTSVALEKSLQNTIERHLDAFLGVRFLASEYTTGAKHGGRMDTLGIDENGCPVIIEYKRALNENVMNQGLYYLDWLLDHRAEFELLVLKKTRPDGVRGDRVVRASTTLYRGRVHKIRRACSSANKSEHRVNPLPQLR